MTKTRTWTFALLGTALTVTFASSGLVMGKGKPTPPPEPEPAIQYQINWIIAPGFFRAEPVSINESGVVVGRASDDSIPQIEYPFVYSIANGWTDLNDLIDPNSGWELASAGGINDSGQIVGSGWINGERHAYRYTPAYTDSEGLLVEAIVDDLGKLDPSDTESRAAGINYIGEVCGYSVDVNGDDHAFYYSDGTGMIEIYADVDSRAKGINNVGQVIGSSSATNTAFRYTPGANPPVEIFSSPDGLQSITTALAINDLGQFTGQTQFAAGKGKNGENSRAYRYSDFGGFEELGTDKNYGGFAINNSGDVGLAKAAGRGMVYLEEESALVNLDDAVTGPEAADWNSTLSTYPYGMNNSGIIVGTITGGVFADNARGFILTPIP